MSRKALSNLSTYADSWHGKACNQSLRGSVRSSEQINLNSLRSRMIAGMPYHSLRRKYILPHKIKVNTFFLITYVFRLNLTLSMVFVDQVTTRWLWTDLSRYTSSRKSSETVRLGRSLLEQISTPLPSEFIVSV